MGAHPVVKGAENARATPYAHPHPGIGFRRCSQERGDGGGDGTDVKTVAHSETTSPSILPLPSAGRRVRDLVLTSLFDIYCLERLLGRLVADEGTTVFRETMIQRSAA